MVCRVRVGLEWEEEAVTILQFSYAPGLGDTLNFSCYVDLDQSSTVNPPKYQKYQAYPKI